MPESGVRVFTDPDRYMEQIRNGFSAWQAMRPSAVATVKGVLTRSGAFRAELTRIDLHRLGMSRGDESLPRLLKITLSGSRCVIFFTTDPDRPAMLVNGMETLQYRIAKFELNSEFYLRSVAACKWGAMSLTPEDLAAVGEAIIGRELAPPVFPHTITPPAPALSRLLKLHEAAGHLAKTAPDILAKPEVARAMEQALVEAMVLCLAGVDAPHVRHVHRYHATVMRRLEVVLEANSDGALYMADLCAAAKVSYATLLACCHEYLGMGPKRYLLLRRMHLARRALRRAEPERTTVTEIATDYGFWELGRFSVVYRSLFGESPSRTLRSNPGETVGSP